jgi:hypothetical protein
MPGEEVAMSASAAAGETLSVVLMAMDGAAFRRVRVPLQDAERGPVTLAVARNGRLLVSVAGSDGYYVLDASKGSCRRIGGVLTGGDRAVFPSAFAERPLAATSGDQRTSTLRRLPANAAPGEVVDVGARENLFWFTAVGAFEKAPEGRYVKHSLLAHLRTDFASPNASKPDFARTDEEFWAGAPFRSWVRDRLATYDTNPPACWEPRFTHRWFTGQAKAWSDARNLAENPPLGSLGG